MNSGGADMAVRRSIHDVEGTIAKAMNPLHEYDVVDVSASLPVEVRDHDGFFELRDNFPRVGVEKGGLHRVGTLAVSFVEQQQQAVGRLDRRCPGAHSKGSSAWSDDGVVVEFGEMKPPVVGVGIPQMVKIIEHGELHVGVNAVDHCHPAVAKVEHNRVLVLDAIGAQQSAARFIEYESAIHVTESMCADPPRHPGVRWRQVRVGHNEVFVLAAGDRLNPRVLVTRDTVVAGGSKHVVEVIGTAVVAGEYQDVGDVVVETRAGPLVEAVAGPHPPGEEVEPVVVVEQTCVEHRAVPRNRSRVNDGARLEPLDEWGELRCLAHHRHRATADRRCRRPGDGLS